ncbi:hypothetical protein NDN13_05255 [Acinetobacter sp. C32I]|uniref:hypothetical protein n=1 Tax=Acinetobacter sp. C32I TaxID=2950074 RepID=UPI002036B56E|nr:hypothetical protein [Acinetobacter sp. C32I]USA54602.1 hypothetical protein NDN13_05255 [Acinetobacter sp. C32I]
MEVIYLLDRCVISWVKDYLENGIVADDKKETIQFLKEIDRVGNIVSILPAIDESIFARKIRKEDKDRFIESSQQDLDAINSFFSNTKKENVFLSDKRWTLEKYFDQIILDSYSVENQDLNLKVLLRVFEIYVENLNKKITNFELIKIFVDEVVYKNKNYKKSGVLLFSLAFLANAGRDHPFSKLFLGRKFEKKMRESNNYIEKRAYNVLYDLTFLKYKHFMQAYGFKNEINIITSDGALSEVLKFVIDFEGVCVGENKDFKEVKYKLELSPLVFKDLRPEELDYAFDLSLRDDVLIFLDDKNRQIRVVKDDKENVIYVYHELKKIGQVDSEKIGTHEFVAVDKDYNSELVIQAVLEYLIIGLKK